MLPSLKQLGSQRYEQCLSRANGRLEQASCIKKELASQRVQLSLAYEALEKQLNDSQRAELTKSQEAWKAFMDREGALAQSVCDPQGLDFGVDDNEIRWTAQRRQQLLRHLSIAKLTR